MKPMEIRSTKLFFKTATVLLLCVFWTANLMSQEKFERKTDIPDGECMVYVYRLPSMTGATNEFSVQVSSSENNKFISANKSAGYWQVYAELSKNTYAPVRLKAEEKYRIILEGSKVPVYFSGSSGSETIIKIEGASYPKFACISGTSYLTRKTFVKEKFENDLFSGNEKLEEYKANEKSKLLKKLKEMNQTTSLSHHIEK